MVQASDFDGLNLDGSYDHPRKLRVSATSSRGYSSKGRGENRKQIASRLKRIRPRSLDLRDLNLNHRILKHEQILEPVRWQRRRHRHCQNEERSQDRNKEGARARARSRDKDKDKRSGNKEDKKQESNDNCRLFVPIEEGKKKCTTFSLNLDLNSILDWKYMLAKRSRRNEEKARIWKRKGILSLGLSKTTILLLLIAYELGARYNENHRPGCSFRNDSRGCKYNNNNNNNYDNNNNMNRDSNSNCNNNNNNFSSNQRCLSSQVGLRLLVEREEKSSNQNRDGQQNSNLHNEPLSFASFCGIVRLAAAFDVDVLFEDTSKLTTTNNITTNTNATGEMTNANITAISTSASSSSSSSIGSSDSMTMTMTTTTTTTTMRSVEQNKEVSAGMNHHDAKDHQGNSRTEESKTTPTDATITTTNETTGSNPLEAIVSSTKQQPNGVGSSGIGIGIGTGTGNNNVNVLCNGLCTCIILEDQTTSRRSASELFLSSSSSSPLSSSSVSKTNLTNSETSIPNLELFLTAFGEDYSSSNSEEEESNGQAGQSDESGSDQDGLIQMDRLHGKHQQQQQQQLQDNLKLSTFPTMSTAHRSTGTPIVQTTNAPQSEQPNITKSVSMDANLNTNINANTSQTNHNPIQLNETSSKVPNDQIPMPISEPPSHESKSTETGPNNNFVFSPPSANLHHFRARFRPQHQYSMVYGRHSNINNNNNNNNNIQNEPKNGQSYDSNIQRLVKLREFNLIDKLNLSQSDHFGFNDFEKGNFSLKLIEKLVDIINIMQTDQTESILLARNDMKFEFWAELYALIVVHLKRHIYHLDLSHNSLNKLGITFTGFLEHHLAASKGEWPFNNQQTSNLFNQTKSAGSSKLTSPQLDTYPSLTNSFSQNINFLTSQAGRLTSTTPSPSSKGYMLTNGGKLFSLVQSKLNENSNSNQNETTILSPTTTFTRQRQFPFSSTGQTQVMLIKALDLSYNQIKWLISDQFRALRHIQTIRLDHNKIRYIHQNAFNGLESLRFLNLNHNKLQIIYIDQFQTNYNLLSLMMRSNHIAYLRAGSFASLSNLKRLDLSKNKLTILGNNALIGLESLEWLNLSSNQFVHVPSASLQRLTSLRHLDLSDNLIAQLRPGTFLHLPVEEIWLDRNDQLMDIERGAFWDLPYLHRLHLDSCSMLMSINSQAFVATTNLQIIDALNCNALEPEARQLLENITTAAAYRRLRLEQQQQQLQLTPATSLPIGKIHDDSAQAKAPATIEYRRLNDNSTENNMINISSNVEEPDKLRSQAPDTLEGQQEAIRSGGVHLINPQLGAETERILKMANNNLSYAYYATSLVFLIVALKLVFKYSSTTHYLGYLRRRRRVYESSTPDDLSLNSFRLNEGRGRINSKLNSDHLQQSEQQPSEPENLQDIQSNERAEEDEQPMNISVICDSITSSIGNEIPVMSLPSCPDCPCHCLQQYETVNLTGDSIQRVGDRGLNPEDVCDSMKVDGIEIDGLYQNQDGSEIQMEYDKLTEIQPTENEDHIQQQQQQQQHDRDQQQQQQDAINQMIQNHLVASGYDYGHANCTHFYQSLGPALQFADMTANFVNQMDYY